MTDKKQSENNRQSRGPVQARSQKRIDAAIAAAEELLVEVGPDKTSIPEIASRADVPRATIYQYFPDKYALFAHMAESQYGRIADAIGEATAGAENAHWHELVGIVVEAVAAFYNANQVAAILLLLGPFGSADGAAHIEKDKLLADLFRARLKLGSEGGGDTAPPLDRITLAIQIAFACLRWGYMLDGRLSPAIRAEAVRATIAYITPFVEDGGRQS